MKRFGVTSDHLALLANDCLDIQPEILPCDIFKSESKLAVNKSYIINSQTSNLSGSHHIPLRTFRGGVLKLFVKILIF